ncbi:hypothetical protein HGRIS_008438 [Hohenbuehelia grisea]|uniref:Uncharacterized protein n=1 Tax=Hohenbuehelia grisea TaxID=104357 RepID=A0ABR3J7Y7_9AGAR
MPQLFPQLVLLLSWCFSRALAQNFTTCVDDGLDWYTGLVGETPCRTYERLRQICNSNYKVTLFSAENPNVCHEQLGDCCCNSIAFGLAVLCSNCQVGGRGNGHDAGPGSYATFLRGGRTNFCTPNSNQTFNTKVQAAVCNTGIKIPSTFYNLLWRDGSWCVEFTKEAITRDSAALGDKLLDGKCDLLASTSNVSSSLVFPSSTSSTTATASSNAVTSPRSKLNQGSIAGITIGVVGILLLASIMIWWTLSRRKRPKSWSSMIPYPTHAIDTRETGGIRSLAHTDVHGGKGRILDPRDNEEGLRFEPVAGRRKPLPDLPQGESSRSGSSGTLQIHGSGPGHASFPGNARQQSRLSQAYSQSPPAYSS